MKRLGLLFRRSPKPGPGSSDRRISPRYPVVQNPAFLSWRKETETRQCPARLLNISSSGVLLFAEESPEQGQTAWICLADPAASEWVETKVISVAKVPGPVASYLVQLGFRKALYLVRLGFTEPCPYTLFKSATHGDQLDATRPEPNATEFDNRYWR